MLEWLVVKIDELLAISMRVAVCIRCRVASALTFRVLPPSLDEVAFSPDQSRTYLVLTTALFIIAKKRRSWTEARHDCLAKFIVTMDAPAAGFTPAQKTNIRSTTMTFAKGKGAMHESTHRARYAGRRELVRPPRCCWWCSWCWCWCCSCRC